ncbi:unnamed protein product [Prorocentrum cordatum]|uniref:Uncharacterized protein n=1 Tax=Prorocentrum cordatum TaxID=2364126 RepID=A0ABN9RIZ1_9DINO|nr:unnamed protein product [Polarella glacialis]
MALIQLPVAQAVFGAAHAGMELGLSAKAMGNLVAAAARGALQGVSAISVAHVEAFETGSTLDKLEEALHAVKKGVGMEATPSALEAKQQFRQLGKSELASKLGKLSKIRNTIGHPPAGLVCDIAQAFEEEKEVGKPCTVFSTGCQEKKLKDKVKSKGKKIVDAQVEAGVSPSGVETKCDVAAPLEYDAKQIEVAVVEPPPNLIDILLEKSREAVELKRHLELAQAAHLEAAEAAVEAGLDVQEEVRQRQLAGQRDGLGQAVGVRLPFGGPAALPGSLRRWGPAIPLASASSASRRCASSGRQRKGRCGRVNSRSECGGSCSSCAPPAGCSASRRPVFLLRPSSATNSRGCGGSCSS